MRVLNSDKHRRRDEARVLVAQGFTLMSIVNSSVAQFVAQRSTLLKRCLSVGRVPQAEPEGRSPEHASADLESLQKDLLPTHGRLSIHDINRHDQFDLLSGIEQREALTTAEKCRTWFKQLFRCALVKVGGMTKIPRRTLMW
jgi:hypothetical protein